MKKIGFAICSLVIAIHAYGQEPPTILIAAASDLKFAMDSLISVYIDVHPEVRVEVTYGSSGKLYEQISHAAPFHLFFSADIEYPLMLKDKGIAISEVYHYGVGRIVIWSRVIDPNKAGMRTVLNPLIRKIAIANPKHAPYGRKTEEALRHFNVYEEVQRKLVYGENISQAAQFVTAGAAEAGILALSLALSPPMKNANGNYYLIPENSHKPLQQGFVILKNAEKNAHVVDFKDFIFTSEAKAILKRYGFVRAE